MSNLVDILNPARTYDISDGVRVTYRLSSLMSLEDALRKGIQEHSPAITGEALDARVAACLNGEEGSEIPMVALAYVVHAGLVADDPGLTVDQVKSLFTVDHSTAMIGLSKAIMGVSGAPVADGDAESDAEGNAEATA